MSAKPDVVFGAGATAAGGGTVTGIVLEDMDSTGKPNNYCFRDGVTVDVVVKL